MRDGRVTALSEAISLTCVAIIIDCYNYNSINVAVQCTVYPVV